MLATLTRQLVFCLCQVGVMWLTATLQHNPMEMEMELSGACIDLAVMLCNTNMDDLKHFSEIQSRVWSMDQSYFVFRG